MIIKSETEYTNKIPISTEERWVITERGHNALRNSKRSLIGRLRLRFAYWRLRRAFLLAARTQTCDTVEGLMRAIRRYQDVWEKCL